MADKLHHPDHDFAAAGQDSLGNREFFSASYLERRRRALEAMEHARGFQGIDEFDPKLPAAHAQAFHTSTRLTSEFRRQHRRGAMDITPQEVIDVLSAAGVKNWVLMGLHGYVGYMPNPRATQDVDVMVPYSERNRATKAITERWPDLTVRVLSQVTRFLDPADLDREGKPKPVIDLLLPWSPFQELILKEYVCVDVETQHRVPTIEAALVSKYAAMISPYRDRDRKEQDAVDFRRLVRANKGHLQLHDLCRLAELVWEGGADEVTRFIDVALSDQPFPI